MWLTTDQACGWSQGQNLLLSHCFLVMNLAGLAGIQSAEDGSYKIRALDQSPPPAVIFQHSRMLFSPCLSSEFGILCSAPDLTDKNTEHPAELDLQVKDNDF